MSSDPIIFCSFSEFSSNIKISEENSSLFSDEIVFFSEWCFLELKLVLLFLDFLSNEE